MRANQRDRREVLLRAVIKTFVQRFIGGEDAVVAHQQRVAIRGRMRDGFGREIASGTRTVLDHERRTKQLLHLLADNAGEHVARSARRERHHQRDGAARIIGRGHGWADCKQGCNAKEGGPNPD